MEGEIGRGNRGGDRDRRTKEEEVIEGEIGREGRKRKWEKNVGGDRGRREKEKEGLKGKIGI